MLALWSERIMFANTHLISRALLLNSLLGLSATLCTTTAATRAKTSPLFDLVKDEFYHEYVLTTQNDPLAHSAPYWSQLHLVLRGSTAARKQNKTSKQPSVFLFFFLLHHIAYICMLSYQLHKYQGNSVITYF